jgi:hypothetical protein
MTRGQGSNLELPVEGSNGLLRVGSSIETMENPGIF